MIQIITSLLILLNPVIGLFTPDKLPVINSPNNKAAIIDSIDYQLPISGQGFLASQLLPMYPIRNWNISEPEITAKTGLIFNATRQKTLWQKNGLDMAMPIASLTKLMTAVVIVENVKLDDIFFISKEAISAYGEMGDLKVDEKLKVKDLLAVLLLESSNDAAEALRENLKNQYQKDLVDLMNKKAKELGLKKTFYADASGLDSRNQSSANDLTKIMEEVLKYNLLREIIKSPAIDIVSADGLSQHHLTNTNKNLTRFPEVLGGKTGYTEEAGNCMITAFIAPKNDEIIISVVMDSQDRMNESAALIEWTKNAFLW